MTKKSPRHSTIPQFALYGEQTPSHQLEFVHIEDIVDRSSRNGWLIKPHRHTHLFQILCMHSGAMRMRLDASDHSLTGGWLVALPAGVVHGFEFQPDTQGVVVSVAVNLQGLDVENQVAHLLAGVLATPRLLQLKKRNGDHRQLLQALAMLKQELSSRQPEQSLALFALVKLVLVCLRRLVQQEQHLLQPPQPAIQLTDRFRQLLETHYKAHWPVADYAAALHVSVSTLNRACSDALGQPAKKLLQARLHVEARRRLTYTLETLDQIAWDLGYKDAAYFSRVFKTREKLTPKTFRQQAAFA